MLHSLPWVQSSSVAQPHQPDGWHTGVFSGVHTLLLPGEHCVHCPARGPDV